MTTLVWFRNDLRVLDHPALTAAAGKPGALRAIFLLCPAQLDEHVTAPIRRHYLRRALDALGTQLAALNIPLDIVDAGHFSQAATTLKSYVAAHQINEIFAHREWLVDEIARDEACLHAGLPLTLLEDCLISPEAILKDDGRPYQVFTPFSKRCRAWLAEHFPRCLPRSAAQNAAKIQVAPCPVFGAEADSSAWPVSEPALLEHLREFCRERADGYKKARDFPALDATSRLSPALALGTISARQCLSRLQVEAGDAIWDSQTGAGCWFNELLWREFYRYIAFHFPRVVRGRAFQTATENLRWRNNEAEFEAWCEGRTGYPVVDAAMRQLNQTGWMHNRLRMITASFLCKDLHIDWRWGERYFLSQLIDADFASNNGGWQWAASTGTDAAPYFRIFNPTSQSERFDPTGDFLRHYVPELAQLKGKTLHAPPATHGYPEPIVDHRWAREHSLAMFADIKAK